MGRAGRGRSRPEVTRLAIRDEKAKPILLVGRRGGVPILWVAPNPTGNEGAALSPDVPRPTTFVPIGGETAAAATAPVPALEAVISPALLLDHQAGGGTDRTCLLQDGAGRALAGTPARLRSPRRQAASTKLAARLLFPLPAGPDTRIVLLRKKPSPPSMASRRGMPLEMRSSLAACSSPSEVIGSTVKPCSSIRNGYSLVPCSEPRYFTMRSRRVEI